MAVARCTAFGGDRAAQHRGPGSAALHNGRRVSIEGWPLKGGRPGVESPRAGKGGEVLRGSGNMRTVSIL
eukprot:365470-Chlamydomonas_euryale.AAC.2